MRPEKENIDDLIHDFFKEKIKGKGAEWNENLPGQHPSVNEQKHVEPPKREIPLDNSEVNAKLENENFSSRMSEEDVKEFRAKQRAQMERRSEEVDEILSFVPHWMIRWGITLLFLILMMLLAMSYYIKYPDVVKGTITLTSTNPPAEVVSRNTGSLLLYEKDKAEVAEGDVIALLKNNADYEDIKNLLLDLEDFKIDLDQNRVTKLKENYAVGDLQNAYSQLIRTIKSNELTRHSNGNNKKRKRNIERQIRKLEQIGLKQKQSIATLEKEYLAGKSILENRYLLLYKKGSISKEQLERKETEVRSQFNNVQAAKVTLTENQNRILDLSAQQSELDFAGTDKLLNSENEISDAYNNLVNEIHRWEQQFLLKAPITGTLNYLQFVKDNMYVKPDQLLASIIPIQEDSETLENTIVGELFIGTEGSGKVEIGQVVNIELNDFIKKEFGMIKGEVNSMADIGTSINTAEGINASYKIDVALPNGLETTLRKQIRFKYNMQGQAEIITKDVRLLERIFSELREALAND